MTSIKNKRCVNVSCRKPIPAIKDAMPVWKYWFLYDKLIPDRVSPGVVDQMRRDHGNQRRYYCQECYSTLASLFPVKLSREVASEYKE